MDQDHRPATPGVCPACGTPYVAGHNGPGCPVCLFQRALVAESEGQGESLNDRPSLPGGERFDHYALVRRRDGAFEELGRGAMGITYRALDTVLGHAVALKVLDSPVAAHPQARERFLREARAAARLRHPNVASVFYYGVRKSDGQCFYAMELVEGESLETRVRREGALPVTLALEVVTQVARALAAADAQGLVHRDLKPANLMLVSGPEPLVKVIDFGLAKAADLTDAADLTQGGFVGTPAFASPEQCVAASVDARSDLYSLGITLWVMLAGKAPFQGTAAEVRQQHLHVPLPLEQLQGVPQPLVVLLETLLAKEPARRLQGPVELSRVLPKVTAAVEAGCALRPEGLRKGVPAGSSAAVHKPPASKWPEKLSLARLPVTGKEVFGREDDLAFLDKAWANSRVSLVTVVAWAGVGKSTLINHWLRRLAGKRYRGAERVFGWSFYRQGTSGEASSADEFLDAALTWFDDLDPRAGSAWEKGERLARLIAQRRSLLVLDGLEPLQHPPGPQEGRLREPALQALLRELAASNRGLCVITTRLPVADLAEHEGDSVRRLDLEHLSSEAGAQLLRAMGVKGAEAELRAASEAFRGHCLALTLLGSYLTDAYAGEIRCGEEVAAHLAHDVRQGAHARKVMESYQHWFGEGPEVSTLRLLGLFDRPADERALGVLRKPPPIPGLTESLIDLSPIQWRMVLARLRRAKLLAEEDPHHSGQLDAHPLVREYFGEQLRSRGTAAWREAHRRLYEHYRALAPELPDSFRAMEPLFLAVTCGCQAGLFRGALHAVYMPRIQRADESFAAKVLGARGALLSVLAHFFEDGRWGSPVQGDVEGQSLTAEDQLFVLMQAAMYLTITRGFGAPEARLCYERAEALCHSLDRPLLLYSALTGQWRHSLLTDRLTVTMQIAQRVYALAQEQNDPALLVGAYRTLAGTQYFKGEFETARDYARRGAQLWRSGCIPPPIEEVHAPVVLCLCYEALSGWHSGQIASSRATMAEAVSLAKELNDTHALAAALHFAGFLGHFERDPAEVERLASALVELSTRQDFAQWRAGGKVLRGWARSAAGNAAEGLAWIDDGIADGRAPGSTLLVPYWLALKAEALHLTNCTAMALEAISEADALAESYGEGWWRAELHRLHGDLLAALGADATRVEASFQEAIHTARQQKSISLLKRAQASCAKYRCSTAKGSGGANR